MSELKLFTFPGPWRLRLFHQARIDESGERLRPDPEACLQGRQGVTRWEHGRVACWLPEGRSRAVLHWTDERTDMYGIIRAEVAANGRLDDLWQAVTDQIAVDAVEGEGATEGQDP